MPEYKNVTKSDLVFSDGTIVAAGKSAVVEAATIVEKAWLEEGRLVLVEPEEAEAVTQVQPKEPLIEPAAAPASSPKVSAPTASAKPETPPAASGKAAGK